MSHHTMSADQHRRVREVLGICMQDVENCKRWYSLGRTRDGAIRNMLSELEGKPYPPNACPSCAKNNLQRLWNWWKHATVTS